MKGKIKEYLKRIETGLMASWFGISNPWGSDSFTTASGTIAKAQQAINYFIAISGLVAVGVIVYGAYMMIIAAGDGDKIEKGQQAIQNGIIGLIIIFVAGAAIKYVAQIILGS